MSVADAIQRQLAAVTSARSEAAVFVRMNGRLAVVNIGTSTIEARCVGFYPPTPGMTVRVDWVNGSPAVIGPATPRSPLGVVTAAGTPMATVTVDGVSETLPVMASYTPVLGDEVLIDWNLGGVITGKLASVAPPSNPGESGGGGARPFSVLVRAANSGRYQPGSGWWGNDPWASSSNDGIWVYGNRVRDAVGSGSVTTVDIFLPLISEVGSASIGVHPHSSLPGGGPAIGTLSAMPLGQRRGWRRLPSSFGPYLAAGGRGVGVLAPGGGGYTQWRGTAADSLSGALRISGTR